MMYILSISNTTDNILQFIATVIMFIMVLVLAYFVTRWVGSAGQKQYADKNIRVIEGYKVGPNKMLQIVKVGNKFFVLGVGKDEISYIGEVEEEDLTITEDNKPLPEFSEILAKAKEKVTWKKNRK